MRKSMKMNCDGCIFNLHSLIFIVGSSYEYCVDSIFISSFVLIRTYFNNEGQTQFRTEVAEGVSIK